MDFVRDTPLEHAVLYWPIRPPRTSMLVVIKSTFVLDEGVARLASAQDPATGELYYDEDPEQSVRYPSDFALLKPRGECFVVGSCRPLTGRPEPRTVASFAIGSVSKSLAIHGDRRWTARGPSEPVPFTAMRLSWERAFGGEGSVNRVGRGFASDAQGDVLLPNVELESQPLTSPGDRPSPAGTTPIPMSWPERRQHVGTYDARWRATRFPWLPEDFRFAFYNEAPLDQQIDGYWRGDEAIALRHLHPTRPSVSTRLPRILPRAFVERTGPRFEEVPLVLDTITIDADRGLALCVCRGAIELEHDRLGPDGIERLFTMHEDLGAPGARASSLEACRARMHAKLAAEEAAALELQGVAPPETAPAPEATLVDYDASAIAEAAAQAERARAAQAELDAATEKLKATMMAAGLDVDALLAQELPAPAEPVGPADVNRLREAFTALGVEVPEDLFRDVEEVLAAPPPEAPAPAARHKPDLRALVIEAHRQRKPVRGDFTGANLSELDLRGLDARDAILMEANFRGADLTDAKLDGASLQGADFLRARAPRASFTKADLTRAIFDDASLEGARFDDATMSAAELSGAILDGASLPRADLTGAVLEEASLVEARLDEAVLIGARMHRCKLTKASLFETRMYEVKATELELDHANLTKVRIGRGADLSRSRIRHAKAEQSMWRHAILTEVAFGGTTLTGADFTGASLRGAYLAGCPLRRAVFQDAVLESAILEAADVLEGSFRQANVTGAVLRGANLFRADFYRAYGERVSLEGANVDGTYWERP
jgi:uncharacterized protein YjbI with pentapeptide repeats